MAGRCGDTTLKWFLNIYGFLIRRPPLCHLKNAVGSPFVPQLGNTVHTFPRRRWPSFSSPELNSTALRSRTFHIRLKGMGTQGVRRTGSTLPGLSLLCFITCGLRERAPCSGFLFLFSHFLLIKLPFSAPSLN